MADDGMVKKLYQWKPICTGLAGNQNVVWENDLKEDLRITKINNWTKCVQNRVKWKEVVVKAKTLKNIVVAPDEAENTRNCGFSIPLCVRVVEYFIGLSLHNNMVQCFYYATNN